MAEVKKLVKESLSLVQAEKVGKAKKFAAEDWPDAEWDWPFAEQHATIRFEFPQQFPIVTVDEIVKRHASVLDKDSTLLPLNPLVADKALGSGSKRDPLRGRVFLDITSMAQQDYPEWTQCKSAFSMWNIGTVMAAHRKWGQSDSNRQGITKASVRSAGGKNVKLLEAMAVERKLLVEQKVITAERAFQLQESQKAPARGTKEGMLG